MVLDVTTGLLTTGIKKFKHLPSAISKNKFGEIHTWSKLIGANSNI
jgi:hypothetical protein